MAILDDIKTILRITTSDLDIEVQDLIDSALDDLVLSGVLFYKAVTTDNLIRRAVSAYCKANFGLFNADSDKYQRSYDSLKTHLALSQDYNAHKITFTVETALGVAIDGATIVIGDDEIETNSLGVAVYYYRDSLSDLDYTVYKSGYTSVESSVYVDGDESVTVVMA